MLLTPPQTTRPSSSPLAQLSAPHGTAARRCARCSAALGSACASRLHISSMGRCGGLDAVSGAARRLRLAVRGIGGGGDGVGCRDGPCVGVAPARSPAVGPGGRASVVGLPLQTPARDADGRRRAGPRGAQWHGGRRRPSRPRASRRPSLRDVERAECVCDSQAEPAPRRQGVAGGRGRTCAGGTRACRVDETPKYPELATFFRRILITNITLASLGGSGNGGRPAISSVLSGPVNITDG
jgi:hypothetical protein